jgi:hypothetical protein
MDYRLKKAYEQVYKKEIKEGWFPETLTRAYGEIDTISESIIGPATPASLPGYYDKINDFLASNPVVSFPVMLKGLEKEFTPDPGQRILYTIRDPQAARDTTLTGTIDNVPANIKVRHIVKTAALKGKSFGNRGQIIEGVLGAALFARLKARPNEEITADDVYKTIQELSETEQDSTTFKTLTKRVEGKEGVEDTFKLEVRLKALPMQSFLSVDTVRLLISENQMDGIVSYTNRTAPRYANHFEGNEQHDYVEVISDGVSFEATSKVDVTLKANNKVLKRYVLSIKEGNTKIIGQKGSGGERAGRQKQYEILESLWKDFGISIGAAESTFLGSASIETAYEIAYEEAANQLSNAFVTNYRSAVQNITKGVIKYGALGEPHLRLVQFTDKGYYSLNFKKLADTVVHDKIHLAATFSNKTRPIISIFDKISGTPFLTFRVFRTSNGYIRNYIEKEDLLINLTKVASSEEKNVESPKQD